MPCLRYFLLLTLLSAGLSPGSLACAQESTAPTASPIVTPVEAEPESSNGGVRQVGPTIYYAWDEEAKKYKAILGTSLADLQQLEALRNQPADKAPPLRFHFSQLGARLTGTADSKRAELTISLGLETQGEDWLAVPLRLDGAILQSANFQGPGAHYIQYDDAAGHVAWLRSGAKEAKYQVELKVLAPLTQVGDESRIDLKLPRIAPITMSLQVATPKAQGVVSSGAQITSTTAQGEGTRFEVQASTSDLRLAWQGARSPTAPRKPAAFEAAGKILARVESATRITWDATFNITVQQGELARVAVRLPLGATLVGEDPAIRPSMIDENSKKNAAQLVEVQFDRVLLKGNSREIRLTCERLLAPRGGESLAGIEVAGFDVQGAAQQHGHIGIVLGDAWHCTATPGNNTLRDDALPEGFREAGVLGSDVYRYVSRANSLLIAIAPRRKKLTLTPTYILDVQRESVTLDARLRYQVLGARTDSCRVDLPGWEIESVELVQPSMAGETLEPIDFDPFATAPLAINLPRTMRGEFEVRIRGRHDLPVDATDFSVPLPRPTADQRQPATILLQAADNIELNFQEETSRGLVPLASAPPALVSPRQQAPLVFEELLDELEPTLAAGFVVQARDISVASLTKVEIGGASMNTVQRLDYTVRFEPIRSLLLLAPRWLEQHESLTVSLQGAPLPREALSFSSTAEPDASTALLRIDLPQPIIGPLTCEIAHGLAMSRLPPAVATAMTVTVLAPQDEALTLRKNQVEVQAESHIQVESSDSRWTLRAATAPGKPLVFQSQAASTQLELLTTYNEPRPRRTTVVEKLWLQTWLAGTQRQERAVFQIRTNDTRVVVQCPSTMPPGELVLLVDGRDHTAQVDAAGKLPVDLPLAGGDSSGEALRRHTIELWWPAAQPASAAALQLAPPSIAGAWVRQVYWHLVLPRQRMIFASPPGMSPEMEWSGWGWQLPRLTQPELEAWSGGTKQDAPNAGQWLTGPAQYLYSSVGQPGELQLATSNASLWMSGLALVALLAAMLLIYVPGARHPALLLPAGVLLLLLAAWWPTAAMLAAHCAVLAIAVVVAARLGEHWLGRRREANRSLGAVVASAAGVRRRRGSEVFIEPQLSRPSTTATAAMSLPLGTEANP